nr:AAA family ATPase [Actinomycetota bacterium]
MLVANVTRGPDGRWSELDGQGLYRSKRAAGVIYQTVLRSELTRRLGVEWGPLRNDVADLAGIPAEVVRMFSKRRVEIEAELDRRGMAGAAAAREAMLTTRTPKVEIDGDALTARWCDEAATVGFGPDDIDRLLTAPVASVSKATLELEDLGTGALVEHDVDVEVFAAQLAEQLIDVDSTFTRHEVMTVAASKLARGASVAGLERVVDWVLAQPEFVPVPDASHGDAGWEQRWTSRRLLDIESDLSEHFAPAARGVGEIDEATVAAAMSSCALGADQVATVHKVTTNGLGVEVIVGRAGSGKTYTMDAVRAVYEHAGYRLVGVAPSARAARELADGAAIDAYTIPRFMRYAAPQLVAADVVIVDEAGMAGTVDLHTIITSARRAGAKVILVGDHHQLPEVAAGGGFAAAVAAAGEHAGELTVNRRQHAEWERAALDELRHGRVTIAFAAYVDHGRVVLRGDVDEIHAAAVADWLTAHRGGEMAMLLAGTRAEARVINDAARAAVGDDLTGPVLEVRGRPFQAGDRIVLLRNDANQHDLDDHRRCRVDNGMIATITAVDIDGDTLDVELINGRQLRLGRDYVLDGHIDHGYATTIHKAQGVTCDRAFVVGPAGLYRQAGYVAMSRPR